MLHLLRRLRELVKPNTDKVIRPISHMQEIVNGLGKFALNAGSERYANEMLLLLEKYESVAIDYQSAQLHGLLGTGYENFAAWYCAGDSAREAKEKAVSFLEKSLELSSEQIQVKVALARLLVEDATVRNLDKGLKLLDELDSDGNLPSYLTSTKAKAERWTCREESSKPDNQLNIKGVTPSDFREERTRIRGQIRAAKKENNEQKLKKNLENLYALGIAAYWCYGEHDCQSAVSGLEYEEALKLFDQLNNSYRYSYPEYGRIYRTNFISENDWKGFEKFFGRNPKSFEPKLKTD